MRLQEGGLTMTKKKIDAFDALTSTDCKMRNAAMVYLYHEGAASEETLHEKTNLAISTIKRYLKKFADLLEWAKSIFYKIKAPKNPLTQENYWVYIDKITMPNGEVWCKIGQTTRSPKTRASEYKWQDMKPRKIEIMYALKCKNFASMQIMEDCFRIAMIKLQTCKYCKNDRLLMWEDDFPTRILENEHVKQEIEQCALAF